MEKSVINRSVPITVPVLLLAFNKPEKTRQVFDAIRRVKPTKLYVFLDAPREGKPKDVELCNQVKDIVQQVDWDCETHYSFQEKNVGCSMAGYCSWKWVYTYEENMIFFEDDAIPSESFFWYAQEMLDRYKDDNRIAVIHSENFGVKRGDASYFFTRSGSGSYGIAWWKRVFDLYEYGLESFDEYVNTDAFIKAFPYKLAYKLRKQHFEHYITNGGNTYDIQFIYLINKYNMYCIVPNVNMITDIGWDVDATNNIPVGNQTSRYANLRREEISEIVHPDKFEIDDKFEKRYYRYRYWDNRSWLRQAIKYYSRVIGRKIPYLENIYHFLKRSFKNR